MKIVRSRRFRRCSKQPITFFIRRSSTSTPSVHPGPGAAPFRLINTLGPNSQGPVLIGNDRVRSSGTFQKGVRDVEWTAESFILNSRGMLYTTLTFETADNLPLQLNSCDSEVNVISYLDQGIVADDQDVLFSVGTPGDSDFRAITINRDPALNPPAPAIGFSHGGIYANDSVNQINADYLGWAADDAYSPEGRAYVFESLQSYSTDPVELLSTREQATLEKLLRDA